MKDGKCAILAIESSCDETAAAVCLDGREVLSNIISSQIEIHKLKVDIFITYFEECRRCT